MATKITKHEIRSSGGDRVERDLKKIGATGEDTGKKIKRGGDQASRGLKAVDAAVGRTRANMRRLADQLGPVGAGLSKLGVAGLAAAGGVVATSGLFLLTKRAVENADALAKQAEAADISVETLQEYRFAASQSGVATDQLDASFVKFAKRVGDFTSSGTGPLVSFLEKFDKSLAANIKNARSQEEALDLVFRRMASLESQAERTALADAAFSETGRALTLVVGENADALENLRQRARDLGIVVGGELVDDATRMNDRLDEMRIILSANMDKALLTLAPAIESVGVSFAKAAPGIASFVNNLLPLESLSLGALAEKAGRLRKKLQEAREAQIKAEANPGFLGSRKREADRDVKFLEEQVAEADALLALRVQESIAAQKLAEQKRNQAQAEAQAREQEVAAEKAAEKAAKAAAAAEKTRLAEREKALDDIARLEARNAKAGLDSIALLAAERDEELERQLSRLEQELITQEEFNRARLAVEQTFQKERAQIEAKEQEKQAVERQKQAEKLAEEFRKPIDNAIENIQREFGDMFTDIFRNGRTESGEFFDFLKDLAARTAGEMAALLVFRPDIAAGGFGRLFQAASGVRGLAQGPAGLANLPGVASAASFVGGLPPFLLAGGGAALAAGVLAPTLGLDAKGAAIGAGLGGAVGSSLPLLGAGPASIFGPAGIALALAGGLIGGKFLGGGNDKTRLQLGASDTAAPGFFLGSRETPFGFVGLTSGSNNLGGSTTSLVSLLAGIDDSIAQLLDETQIANVRAGVTGGGQVAGRRSSFNRLDDEVFDIAKERLTNIIDALAGNQVASGLLDSIARSQDNVEALVGRGQEIVQLINLFADDGGELSEAEQALKAINDQFDQLANAAGQLGFSVAQAETRRAEAIAKLTGDFEGSIRDQILAITDPFTLALEAQERTAQERLDNARTLGANLVEVERLNALERAKIIEESLGDGLSQFTQANQSISRFLESLDTGAAGGLTVAARAGNFETQFNALLSAARTDPTARSDLADLLPGFVDIKREQLGSTESFFEFTGFLRSTLGNLVDQTSTVRKLNDLGSAIVQGDSAVVAQLQALQEQLVLLRRENAQLRADFNRLINSPAA